MPTDEELFEEAFENVPDFRRHSNRIKRTVGGARNRIVAVLSDVDIENLTRKEQARIVREVNAILDELDEELEKEVEESVNDIWEHGAARALLGLGIAGSMAAAVRKVREGTTSRSDRAARNAVVETSMEDLLAMTQNTRRRVKSEVRQVAADVFRMDENARQQARDMSNRLKDSGVFAIRDSANRRWKIDHYTDVVMKTKMNETHRTSTIRESERQGAGHVVVSTHGDPCPKCVPWEGTLLRIDEDVDGTEPTLDEAIAAGLFHPGCLHHITPVRSKEILPSFVKT